MPKRIVFDNKDATMEVMGQGVGEVLLAGLGQRASCNGPVLPLSKAVNAGNWGLSISVLVFAAFYFLL